MFNCHPGETDIGPTYEAVEGLDRIVNAGLIKVDNLDPKADVTCTSQPDKVVDLRRIATSYHNKTVTLKWTAVGDCKQEPGRSRRGCLGLLRR